MRVSSTPIDYAAVCQNEKYTITLHNPSSDALRRLTEVKSLIITGRLISESFRALCKLSELKELDLSQTNIPYGEFRELNKLKNLENLKLSLNHLKEIPTCPIPSLRELYERNVCIEVSDSNASSHCSGEILEHMPYVKKAHVKSLTFTGYLVPYCFHQLCELNEVEELDLTHAMIPYRQFQNIEKLVNLKILKLSSNQLKEMPPNLQPLLKELEERRVLIEVPSFDESLVTQSTSSVS